MNEEESKNNIVRRALEKYRDHFSTLKNTKTNENTHSLINEELKEGKIVVRSLDKYYHLLHDGFTKEECDFSNIGLSEEDKKLVDNALYYMGNNGTINSNYINEYYNLERTSGTWIGKVGIMYASDYLYASDLSLCKNTGNNYSNDSNCYDNWLFNKDGNQNILLTSDSTDSNYVLSKDGNIEKITGDNGYVSQPRVVKPVLYLNNNVKIVSGTGAKSDPYKLSI